MATFLEVPIIPEIFQLNVPIKYVPFSSQPEFPEMENAHCVNHKIHSTAAVEWPANILVYRRLSFAHCEGRRLKTAIRRLANER